MCEPEAMDDCTEAESSEYGEAIAQMNRQQLGLYAQDLHKLSDENPT